MPRVFLFSGALIFIALGAYHGFLTLRDISTPRAFTPTDESVRRAMQESRVALNRSINLWDAWLGFNLSHSLGLIVFGGGLLTIAWLHFPVFARSPSLQVAALVVAATYFVLALRFWFWAPALATGICLACFLAAFLLLRAA
ncbi:hypothetical protein DWF00_15880 [Bosea caraganae]|uniref:Uncharacterized protein n=1 Tax=Bosea caraganae TaxID=2763117 RepID=A0A370L6V0_9HYPH|nr:hypothetical protein [Bosea caraganae]RDJ25353.1 hypothetical protein DWE98_11505 [Bosea caraganae]RDJ25862.1 hypothetical protein DWF00_15880 [Bosea caraganae]